MPQHHNISISTIRGLWNYWAIAFGAIAAVMVCSLFISKTFLPFLLFAFSYGLVAKMKADSSSSKMGSCYLIMWAMTLILFWSAIIMLIINLIYSKWFFGGTLAVEPFNPRHPYVCSLIIFPVSLVISIYFLIRRHSLRVCRTCQARFGYYSPNSTVALLYFHEARFQLRLLLWLSLVLSIIDWSYYHFFYINVNFNKPDKFYFIVMPIAVYLLSLVYMSIRYMSITDEMISAVKNKKLRPMLTIARFLIFSGDAVYLTKQPDDLTDTPAQMTVPRRETLTDDDARSIVSGSFGLSSDSFNLRYLYSDSGYQNDVNVIHYAVFLNDEAQPTIALPGKWMTIDEVDRQLKARELAPLLLSELHRIYNITMAWKTYDRNGHRLYPIKHYHPTFRLRDLPRWNVDYNDLSWLDVATNNQDRPFFKIRRLWRKYFRN